MTQPQGLVIGPGFQTWIDSHQGTPLSDETYFSRELSCMQVQIADADGQPLKGMLWYNRLTNAVDWDPFARATQ